MNVLKVFLEKEYEWKSPAGKGLHDYNVDFDFEDVNVPLQKNDDDCGVWVCALAYCLVFDLELDTFSQRNMPFFREHICNCLREQRLKHLIIYPTEF